MKRNFSDYLTSLVVILCSATLLGALTLALSGYRPHKDARTLEIDYPDITGIRLHSEVRYAGAPAGRVVAIRHLTLEERASAEGEKQKNAVRVTVELRDDVPPLPGDVRAALASETLLSEKFVALSAGSPTAPRLAKGAVLQGHTGGNIDDLLSSMGPLLQSVESVIASIQPVMQKAEQTLDAVKGGVADAMPRISSVAESAKTAAESADAMVKRVDKLITENEGGIKANLQELRTSLTKMQDVLNTTNGFVKRTDRSIADQMKDLSVVLQNLKVATTQTKAFTETVARQPHRLIWGGKPNKLTPEETIIRTSRPVPAKTP